MPRVLVVARREAVRNAVGRALDGWEIHICATQRELSNLVGSAGGDLIVAECGSVDSIAPFRRVSLASGVPVIVIGSGAERGDGFGADCIESGADDYVSWPFSDRELRARAEIRALGTKARSGRWGGLEINGSLHQVFVDGRPVELTNKEYDLLTFLVSAPDRAFSKQQLLSAVWRSTVEWQSDATVTEHVHRLRQKLERDSARPEYIVTVPGVGYRFQAPATVTSDSETQFAS